MQAGCKPLFVEIEKNSKHALIFVLRETLLSKAALSLCLGVGKHLQTTL